MAAFSLTACSQTCSQTWNISRKLWMSRVISYPYLSSRQRVIRNCFQHLRVHFTNACVLSWVIKDYNWIQVRLFKIINLNLCTIWSWVTIIMLQLCYTFLQKLHKLFKIQLRVRWVIACLSSICILLYCKWMENLQLVDGWRTMVFGSLAGYLRMYDLPRSKTCRNQ